MKRARLLPACLLIAVAVLWVYSPAAAAPFQFDDALILADDNLKSGEWSPFLWPPQPRLLTWLTFLLQYQLHGDDAGPFHLVNVALHAVNAVLVFLLLFSVLRRGRNVDEEQLAWACALGSLVFALHPLQTEAVVYVYQRSTLLAAGFAFCALLFHVRNRPGLAVLFLLPALLSKEFTVVVPALMWLHRGMFVGRWKPDPWLAAGLGLSLAAGIWWLAGQGAGVLAASVPYALTQVKVICLYLGLTLAPLSLNLDRHIIRQDSVMDPVWWLALVSLAALLWLLWRQRTRRPALSFLGLSYFLFLLPTSSFVPSPDFMFEHRAYASLLGFAALATAAALTLEGFGLGRLRTRLLWLALSALPVILYVEADRERIRIWSDEADLWRDTARKSPRKYRPNYNLGVILMKRGSTEAADYLARAMSIDPARPQAYRALGEFFLARGDAGRAEDAWMRALRLDPRHAGTHLALGGLYARRADFFRARRHLTRSQQLDPSDWRSYFHLARLNLRFGFVEQAVIMSEMGLARRPGEDSLQGLLADAVAANQNWERAIELYLGLLESSPGDSRLHYRLGRALFEAGRRREAVAAIEKGIAAAPSQAEKLLGRELLESMARDRRP